MGADFKKVKFVSKCKILVSLISILKKFVSVDTLGNGDKVKLLSYEVHEEVRQF